MALVNGHGAQDPLGEEVVVRIAQALTPPSHYLRELEVVRIGPAREPVLRITMADGTRADFRLEQWELVTRG
jgi:hypothetical protein